MNRPLPFALVVALFVASLASWAISFTKPKCWWIALAAIVFILAGAMAAVAW